MSLKLCRVFSVTATAGILLATGGLLSGGCGGSASVGQAGSLPSYSISPQSGQSGTIFPSTPQTITRGGKSPTFTALGNGSPFIEWQIDGVATPRSKAFLDGERVWISGNNLMFGNVSRPHTISAMYSGSSISFSVYNTLGEAFATSPAYCSSESSYALCNSVGSGWISYVLESIAPNSGVDELQVLPTTSRIWGVNESGWALYATQGDASIAILDTAGNIHSVTSSLPADGAYAITDSGTLMYAVSPSGNGAQPAQFYTQSGWDASTSAPISPDVRGYFMNNAGVIIGTSNGLGTVPKGSPVAYVLGREVALPLVKGTLSGFSNTGILVTVPSPGAVNLYSNNGQSVLAHITDLDVDTISHGAGGYLNPYNRVIGCNSSGDIKIIGRSTAAATYGDWGYWDSDVGKFVDITALMQWNILPAQALSDPPATILKLWAISDTDLVLAALPNSPPGTTGSSSIILAINNPVQNTRRRRDLKVSIK